MTSLLTFMLNSIHSQTLGGVNCFRCKRLRKRCAQANNECVSSLRHSQSSGFRSDDYSTQYRNCFRGNQAQGSNVCGRCSETDYSVSYFSFEIAANQLFIDRLRFSTMSSTVLPRAVIVLAVVWSDRQKRALQLRVRSLITAEEIADADEYFQ